MGESAGDGERIPGQRARLVDGAERGEPVHQPRRPAVRADRQAAADHLAESDEIGFDAELSADGDSGDPEPAQHFVEDQQCAVLAAQAAQELQIVPPLHQEAVVRR